MNKKVQCLLCPRECILLESARGDCRVRMNINGELNTLVYGKVCAANADPIEKKPLYHFLPGTSSFSIATAGCNLHCKFCQNWSISQEIPEKTRNLDLQPEKLVRLAREKGCRSIAYTYTEPTVYFEYMYDSSVIAVDNGLKNVWVTAGFIKQEPLSALCRVMQAANIDLKSIKEEYYRDICSGELKPVLETIVSAKKAGVWVELTNLVVPTLNDTDEDFRMLARWVKENAGPKMPLHFSRFWPMYRLKNLPPTPEDVLVRARDIAISEGLKYVYIGNIPGHPGSDTYCSNCGRQVIKRIGYTTNINGIDGIGRCLFCGERNEGIWQ